VDINEFENRGCRTIWYLSNHGCCHSVSAKLNVKWSVQWTWKASLTYNCPVEVCALSWALVSVSFVAWGLNYELGNDNGVVKLGNSYIGLLVGCFALFVGRGLGGSVLALRFLALLNWSTLNRREGKGCPTDLNLVAGCCASTSCVINTCEMVPNA